jgi:hypothetical protein
MNKLGSRLIRAAREGRAVARGEARTATYRIHVPTGVDVRKIRKALKNGIRLLTSPAASPGAPDNRN